MKTFYLITILIPALLTFNGHSSNEPIKVSHVISKSHSEKFCAPTFFFYNQTSYTVSKIIISYVDCTTSKTFNNPVFPFSYLNNCAGPCNVRFIFQGSSGSEGSIDVTNFSTHIANEPFEIPHLSVVSFDANCYLDYQIKVIY
ncbi:hypothetical protein [Terrimonas sp.]|uniref:hypothetical protein n=1 Tax=Terrimonas sp. TaxID=1914338 RepID=UPI0010571EC0|nr:hypothetical protein [Terrimonas sp.]